MLYTSTKAWSDVWMLYTWSAAQKTVDFAVYPETREANERCTASGAGGQGGHGWASLMLWGGVLMYPTCLDAIGWLLEPRTVS